MVERNDDGERIVYGPDNQPISIRELTRRALRGEGKYDMMAVAIICHYNNRMDARQDSPRQVR